MRYYLATQYIQTVRRILTQAMSPPESENGYHTGQLIDGEFTCALDFRG